MKVKTKKAVVITAVVLVALLALALGAWGVTHYFIPFGDNFADGLTISFDSDVSLMRGDAITAPASGYVRRSFAASVFDAEGYEKQDAKITYSLSKEIEGVELAEDGMLSVFSGLEKNATFDVTASFKTESGEPYYLRNWVDDDSRTLCDYRFDVNGEDTALVISADRGRRSWSSQNSGVVVSGISSFEHNYLHKFGALGEGAVFNKDVGVFDGMSTKYGYFELRMRMPDTRDGSHFAWWMIGVQDDMNDTALLDNESVPMSGHYSNQTGEIDIIETTLTSLEGMKAWRPVIHPNGTTDYEYHWVDEGEIPGNPMLEYHIYGFEWDESGVKFYVDNKLVSSSDRSPSYRMMTFLTLYATGGLGEDRGIYPKEAFIDYLRVYKRSGSADKPMSVQLDMTSVPDAVYVPQEGENENVVKLNASVLDGMDRVMAEGSVKWRLSETVDGFAPASSAAFEIKGVSLSADGTLTVTSAAWEGSKDLFVTAYVSDVVKQTYHLKLSRASERDDRLMFEGGSGLKAVFTLEKGQSLTLEAGLYDQYLRLRDVTPQFFLARDLAGGEKLYEGVTLEGATLTVSADSPLKAGDIVTVVAEAGSKKAAAFIKVT